MNVARSDYIHPSIRADFEALRERLRGKGYFEKRPVRVISELVLNLVLAIGGMLVCAQSDQPLVRITALLVSGYGTIGVTSNTHTSSHEATSNRWWLDECLTFFGFPFTIAMATSYWRHHHLETHHLNTNVVGVDYDVDLAPWFLLNQSQISRSSRWAQWYYHIQWLFFPVAVALNAFSIQLSSLRFVWSALCDRRRRRLEHGIDLGAMALHWLVWAILPMAVWTPSNVLAIYVLRMSLVGYGMFIAAAPAHYPAEAAYLDREGAERVDFLLHQTTATIDFPTGWLGYLFYSGADYQIEHHLFPEISHVHYRRMQPEVEAFCHRHGYPYRRLGWLEAVWKSYRTLISPKQVARSLGIVPAMSTPADHASVA